MGYSLNLSYYLNEQMSTIKLIVFLILPIFLLIIYVTCIFTFPVPIIDHPRRLQLDESKRESIDVNVDEGSFMKSYPDASKELIKISDLIIRDYISNWFTRIDENPNSEFPQEVKRTLLGSFEKLQIKAQSSDTVELVILKLLPLITRHFKSYCIVTEDAYESKSTKNETKKIEELQFTIDFNKRHNIHNALSLKPDSFDNDITCHVRSKVRKLLPFLLNKDDMDSELVVCLLVEILTTNIFAPLLIKFSDPDNWNIILSSISTKILDERNQVEEVRKVLFQEVKNSEAMNSANNDSGDTIDLPFELSESITDEQFEEYLQQLSLLTSLSDLRATKFSLVIKLHKIGKKKGLSKCDVSFKKRLILSLNIIDTKLKYMGYDSNNSDGKSIINYNDIFDNSNIINELESFIGLISMESIVNEDFCLAYFEKYLSNYDESAGLEYLKYWQLVESFKNPLEDPTDENIIIQYSDIEVEHMVEVSKHYFSDKNLLLMDSLDKGLVKNVKMFTENRDKMREEEFILARKSLLLLHNQAMNILSQDYLPSFKNSNIFVKMISSPDFISTDLYAKYFNSNRKGSSITNTNGTKLNTVKIFSSPGVNDALEKIVNDGGKFDIRSASDIKITTSSAISNKSSKNNLVEEFQEDQKFNEALFDDDVTIHRKRTLLHNSQEHSVQEDNIILGGSKFITNGMNNDFHEFTSLRTEINDLSVSIDEIEQELDILKYLILKADLTNNQKQLKLLKKSQRMLLRELGNKEQLKQQYIVQEHSNSLYKKTKIKIKSYYIDSTQNALREVVYYIINIDHIHNEQVTSWELPRRFNEFYDLHSYLKKNYKIPMKPIIKSNTFPKKNSLGLKYHIAQKPLCEERKQSLARYLSMLLDIPEVCRDDIFRNFLTNTDTFSVNMKTHNRLLVNESSLPTSEVSSLITNSSEDGRSRSGSYSHIHDAYGKTSEDDQTVNLFNQQNLDAEEPNNIQKSIIKPICDLFISVFSLNKSNLVWLRGGAIIIILQQLFGSTVERYVRESIQRIRSEPQVVELMKKVEDAIWGPNGSLERRKHGPIPERTHREKRITEHNSQVLLQALLVELVGKVVGLRHAKVASTRVHGVLQNRYLNASLLLEAFDLVLDDIFFMGSNGIKSSEASNII